MGLAYTAGGGSFGEEGAADALLLAALQGSPCSGQERGGYIEAVHVDDLSTPRDHRRRVSALDRSGWAWRAEAAVFLRAEGDRAQAVFRQLVLEPGVALVATVVAATLSKQAGADEDRFGRHGGVVW